MGPIFRLDLVCPGIVRTSRLVFCRGDPDRQHPLPILVFPDGDPLSVDGCASNLPSAKVRRTFWGTLQDWRFFWPKRPRRRGRCCLARDELLGCVSPERLDVIWARMTQDSRSRLGATVFAWLSRPPSVLPLMDPLTRAAFLDSGGDLSRVN